MTKDARTRIPSLIIGLVTVVVGACAPQSAGTGPSPSEDAKPVAKKVLTIGDSYEPKWINENYTSEFFAAGNNVAAFVQDGLSFNLQYQNVRAQLASEVPSIETGSWKVNPDGTMETIWKLRPNIKWHDGQPFTSADLTFTFQVKRDKDIGGTSVSVYDKLIDSVSAPDDLTFIFHWNAPYVDANSVGPGTIVPQHLLKETYLKDKFIFQASPLLSSEFVGLGPYRMVRWERGSLIQLDRFDNYYMGRPNLDTVYFRFVTDATTLIANILSGAVDVAISSASQGVSLDQAAEVQKRWAGTRNQVVNVYAGGVLWTEAQFNPEYARPANTMSDLNVRKALISAIDRTTLAEVMTHGLSTVPDSYFVPDDPRRPQLDPHIVKYPYNPTLSAQFLTEGGWQKGSDGVWARQSDGQRLQVDFLGRAGPNEKVASIVADFWQKIGVDAKPIITPEANRNDREYETKRPGYLCCVQVGENSFNNGKLHQRQIPSAATNWVGINYGSYANPRADILIDKLAGTLDPRERLPLQQQIIQLYTADVAMIPMWWQILPELVVAGVKGPNPAYSSPNANKFEWDKE